ncbi:hypothetical protein Vadar_012573 [Vaccinium darrowii]|uniref:Uncharacterized protein n=1 Tax=Vaccinium darrowii TaxID=229202 RepID=A0ACB7YEC7_9ERIC|nr:hypothetical protein Vadar_012573 [Vaccinium darrowii]
MYDLFEIFYSIVDMSAKVVTLLIHIRGRLIVEGPHVSYDNGPVAETTVLDTNRFHYYDLLEVLSGLECSRQSKLVFKLPQCIPTNHIVSELQCETNMRKMFNMYETGAKINMYVDDPFEFEDDMDSEMEGGVNQEDEGERGVDQEDDGEGGVVDQQDEEESDPDYEASGSEGDHTSGMNDSSDDDMDDDEDVPTNDEGTSGPINDEGTSGPRNDEGTSVPRNDVPDFHEVEGSDRSDDQKSLAASVEDGRKDDEYEEFVEERDMKNPRLVCGMLFPNVRKFRALLKEYHIKEGFEFKYLKNEGTRVIVQCIHNPTCSFRLHASRTHDNGSFHVGL